MRLLICLLSLLVTGPLLAQDDLPVPGDAERGRLVFAQCRTCHYAEAFMGHNNGPNLHRIFGKVAGKQEGFAYYSETFRQAEFVWTPALMYAWGEPDAHVPGFHHDEPGGARCAAAGRSDRVSEAGLRARALEAKPYFLTITDEPWPNRPWLAVIPTLAPSTWRSPD